MRVTRFEAAIVAGAMGLVAGGIGLFTRSASAVTEREMAEEDARRVLRAAESWLGEHAHTGCPTLSRLQEDGHLPAAARTDDPWGERFRIQCEGAVPSVKSAGQDGRMRTDDDIVVVSTIGS
jgi:general secretion pathway protein G